jgi:Ca2+-binding EF-hand superfamily protein
MMEEADANNDGVIDFPEFVAVFMRFLGKRNTLPNVECFNDIFDGKYLSSIKMHEEMKILGIDVSAEEIEKLIVEADIDGNKKIDKEGLKPSLEAILRFN